jgi:hypothetical protein
VADAVVFENSDKLVSQCTYQFIERSSHEPTNQPSGRLAVGNQCEYQLAISYTLSGKTLHHIAMELSLLCSVRLICMPGSGGSSEFSSVENGPKKFRFRR